MRALVLFGKYGQRKRWREQTRSDILKAGARRLTVESRARAANLLAQSSSAAMFSVSTPGSTSSLWPTVDWFDLL